MTVIFSGRRRTHKLGRRSACRTVPPKPRFPMSPDAARRFEWCVVVIVYAKINGVGGKGDQGIYKREVEVKKWLIRKVYSI